MGERQHFYLDEERVLNGAQIKYPLPTKLENTVSFHKAPGGILQITHCDVPDNFLVLKYVNIAATNRGRQGLPEASSLR